MTFREAKVKDPAFCPRCGVNPRGKIKSGWCASCVSRYNKQYHKENPRGYAGKHKTRFRKLEMEVLIRVMAAIEGSPYMNFMNREERAAFSSALKKMQGKEANV